MKEQNITEALRALCRELRIDVYGAGRIDRNWTLMIPKTEVDSNTALQGMNNPDPSGAIAKRPTPIGEFAPGNN